MKLSQRSYPHPVVGNSDDVVDAAFQATLEASLDKENIYIDSNIICSSATINDLLKSGAARFIVHVECSNTMFRKAFEFDKTTNRISISRDNVNDDVEVNTFVRATRDLANYEVQGAHPDYASAKFYVKTGDILAVGEGRVFTIENNFESTSRVGSIMQIRESVEDGDLPMSFNPNGDKILITLSKPDFSIYKILKSHESLSGPLTTSIVLPVLLEALHIIASASDSQGDDDPRRWVRVLTRRIKALELDKEDDLLILAQRLLELPIKRALVGAKQSEDS